MEHPLPVHTRLHFQHGTNPCVTTIAEPLGIVYHPPSLRVPRPNVLAFERRLARAPIDAPRYHCVRSKRLLDAAFHMGIWVVICNKIELYTMLQKRLAASKSKTEATHRVDCLRYLFIIGTNEP